MVRVAFNVGWKVPHAGKTELAASTCSPTINIAADINSNCVAIATSDLVNTLLSELFNLQWKWLNAAKS